MTAAFWWRLPLSWSISHSRSGRLLAALTFAATCLSGVSLITLAAPKPSAGQKAAAASAAAKEGDEAAEKDSERGIRLYYFQAHWRIVLSDIAKATKTKVVAEKYPFRLYTRFDRRK